MRVNSAAYCSSVYSDGEFLRVGVVDRINPDDFHPLHRFHSRFGLEKNVRHDRHDAATGAEFTDDMLEVRCVLYRPAR